MACKCPPALNTLTAELNAIFPDRDRRSDGCCGDAAHNARRSDHNANVEGWARAKDLDEDLIADMGDRQLWTLGLILLSDPRTKYIIYEKRILYPDGTNKEYFGINDHRSHLHLSIHDWAVLDTRPWNIHRAFRATPTPEEDDMPMPKVTYVQVKGQTAIHVAGMGVVAPRQVGRFRDVDTHVGRVGGVELVKPTDLGYPLDWCDKLKDSTGDERLVLILDNGSDFGVK